MTLTDADLVHRARNGDQQAFEELVFRHDKKVFALAARYVTSADEAKDIYQEVFIKVYRGLKHFQSRSEFSTWLHRITVNVCLTHRARSRTSTYVRLGEDVEGEIDETHPALASRDPGGAPDRQAVNAEVEQRVEQALSRLSPKQRMVFTLKHLQGYRLREIAAMMHCTQGTVKRYLFDATARLRDQLKDTLS
ncbi:MAG TPA: sigma-70 family RNA polymerase sigma factor [Bacteroidota bacterium]